MAEHLTKESFKLKVFDYSRGGDWKYLGKTPALIDFYAVTQKADDLVKQINDVILSPMDDSKLQRIETLKAKIKRMRKCGLETGGEYSVENLAFKVLRNEGHIKNLWDESVKTHDYSMSLESNIKK